MHQSVRVAFVIIGNATTRSTVVPTNVTSRLYLTYWTGQMWSTSSNSMCCERDIQGNYARTPATQPQCNENSVIQ